MIDRDRLRAGAGLGVLLAGLNRVPAGTGSTKSPAPDSPE
jgi:hypothetical protein